jgi:hypothetical protein
MCKTLRLSLIVGIGIATTVLLKRENGVVCLPRFNVAAAALGLAFDLLLDFFLIYQAIKLFSKSDEDTRQAEFIVLTSCLSLLSWHLVYRPISLLTIVFYFVSIQSWQRGSTNSRLLYLSRHSHM